MTRVLKVSSERRDALWFTVLALTLTALAPLSARGASVTQGVTRESEPERLAGDASHERLIVEPEPLWNGWGEWRDGWHEGGPRINVWVDRGDWSTYGPGDRLRVYFRVDRPCFVTIIDYAPGGRVDVIYPNRWSGSNFVRPGRTYRLPESRTYSLRIAGPGGVEKLVACAHQAPWPSGPRGSWIPPFEPRRGRVVVGRPGGGGPPGRPGRAVSTRGVWPVPRDWYDHPSRWGCDEVSFYVADRARRGDSRYRADEIFHEWLRMERCDDLYRNVYFEGGSFTIQIACVESRDGDPTEIVGRAIWNGGSNSDPLFRIDVEGRHGDRPAPGRVYAAYVGPIRIEVEIDGVELKEPVTRWSPEEIDWIRFDVRAFAGR